MLFNLLLIRYINPDMEGLLMTKKVKEADFDDTIEFEFYFEKS